MSNNDSLHSILSSKAAAFLSWLSAFMGIGTFMGFVNAVIGILSAGYLALQIWNWWYYTRPINALKLQQLRQDLEQHRKQ